MNLHWVIYGYDFSLYAAFSFLTGVLLLFQCIFILYQNWKSPVSIAAALLSLSCFVWLTGTALQVSSASAETAEFWMRHYTNHGVFMIAPCIYFFSTVFNRTQTPQQRIFVVLGYVLALVFSVLILTTDLIFSGITRFYWGFWPEVGSLRWLYHLFFSSFYVASLWNFWKAYKKETDPLRKKQAGALILAFVIAFFGSIDYLPEYNLEILPVGFIFLISFVFVIFYSIIQYRLLDIESVLHKTLMWLLASAVLGGPMVAFFYLQKEWVYHLPTGIYITLLIMSFITVVLYTRHVQPRIDHLFQRKLWNLNLEMEQFNDALVDLRDLSEIGTHILNTIHRLFYAGHVSLLIGKNDDFYEFSTMSSEIKEVIAVKGDNPFLKQLESHDHIILQKYYSADPRFKDVQDAGKRYFDQFQNVMCVPLLVNRRLLGVLNLGKKKNLRRYNSVEMTFLNDFRRSVAIALSNAIHLRLIQENLKKWNEELERKVEERTEQLKDTQAQLIQAEKLATIGTLAGGVAHEINNPLTAVLTNAQILKMGASSEDAESLELIEEGAKRCQVIIQNLLKYARRTDPVANLSQVDPREIIENVCSLLEYQFKQDNVELVLSLKKVSKIEGISNELEQVLTNLLVNARDAISLKKGDELHKIWVSTEQKSGKVSIQVKDNGRGMSKDVQKKIFDPFFTTKDVGGGTGLGLAISYGIIQKHGGEIHVESEEGKGTTFTMQFPLLQTQGK